jgi:nucleoside-diphosphate-sugar epimerase
LVQQHQEKNTPQYTIMEPSTVYGISKQSGERWCEYYHNIFGVCEKHPLPRINQLFSPGGGTTDYAVDIFHKALADKKYECFLSSETKMPMMYMDDAIAATIQIMQRQQNRLKSVPLITCNELHTNRNSSRDQETHT